MTDTPTPEHTIEWGKELLGTQKKRKMPKFLDPSALPKMTWVGGEELNEGERVALVNLLRQEDHKTEVPELRQLRTLLTDNVRGARAVRLPRRVLRVDPPEQGADPAGRLRE